jgi:hydrogenase expression/formation protein HypE
MDKIAKGKNILLGHGSGGKLSHDLINELFITHFQNNILSQQTDSAILPLSLNTIAFTTDAYVVDLIPFFSRVVILANYLSAVL